MGLLSKIKLFFTEEKEEETVKEIITMEELPSRLEEKINELAELKKKIKDQISNRVSSFEIKVNENIVSLENVDISQRKEYDQIKIIVRENLALYISHLKRAIVNIKDAEKKEEVERYLSDILYTLKDLSKASSRPFERATILIGNELSSTKETINLFIRDINKIAEDTAFIFEKSRQCAALSSLLSESKQIALLCAEAEERVSEMNASLEYSKQAHELSKKKLSEMKECDDFKASTQDKIDYNKKLDSLGNEIDHIKGRLNLKRALKKFHHDKRKDQLIRSYITNFKDTLKEDRELKITDMLEEDNKEYLSRLKEIQESMFSLIPPAQSKIELDTLFLEETIKKDILSMFNLEENIQGEMKRKEKLSVKLQKINADLREESKLLFN